jgi:hypothetical protein
MHSAGQTKNTHGQVASTHREACAANEDAPPAASQISTIHYLHRRGHALVPSYGIMGAAVITRSFTGSVSEARTADLMAVAKLKRDPASRVGSCRAGRIRVRGTLARGAGDRPSPIAREGREYLPRSAAGHGFKTYDVKALAAARSRDLCFQSWWEPLEPPCATPFSFATTDPQAAADRRAARRSLSTVKARRVRASSRRTAATLQKSR